MYLQNSGDFICSDHMKHKGQQFYMPQEQEVLNRFINSTTCSTNWCRKQFKQRAMTEAKTCKKLWLNWSGYWPRTSKDAPSRSAACCSTSTASKSLALNPSDESCCEQTVNHTVHLNLDAKTDPNHSCKWQRVQTTTCTKRIDISTTLCDLIKTLKETDWKHQKRIIKLLRNNKW